MRILSSPLSQPSSLDQDADTCVRYSSTSTEISRRWLKSEVATTHGAVTVLKTLVGGFKSVTRLLQVLGTWGIDKPELLTLKLNIELDEFSLYQFEAVLTDLPVVPAIGTLQVVMLRHSYGKLPLALLQLLGEVPRLMAANLHLSPRNCSSKVEKDTRVQGESIFTSYRSSHNGR